jgi:hypothetical protein
MAKNPDDASKNPAFLNTLTITPQDNMVSASIEIGTDDIKNLTKGLMGGPDSGGPSDSHGPVSETNAFPSDTVGKPMPFPGATSTQANNPFGATGASVTPPKPSGAFPPPPQAPQVSEKPAPTQTATAPNSGDPFAN